MIKSKKINFTIIFLFVGIWISIGSDPYNFLFLFESDYQIKHFAENLNFKDLINLFRAIFPLFCCIVCLIFLIKYNLYKNQKKFLKILLVIQLIQIFSTFLSTNSIMSEYEGIIDHIGRYNWLISSIATIFIFMIASKLQDFDLRILFYVSIFFLILIVFWFSITNISDFYLLNIKTSIYNMDVLRDGAFFLNHQMPRVTGLSRSIVILYLVIFILSQSSLSKFKGYLYILLSILGALIFIYQSKYALGCYIIMNIIFFLNFTKKKKVAKIIISLFLIQLFIFYCFSNSRVIIDIYKNKMPVFNSQVTITDGNFEKFKHFRSFDDANKKGIYLTEHLIMSGRIGLWNTAIDFIKDRPFLGYGSMSDRDIINKKRIEENYLLNPVSNAFLYSILSGGIFCLILFLMFWWSIRNEIFNVLSLKKIPSEYHKIGIIIITLIGLRCIIENSIMVFGIDYILILNSLYLTQAK